MAFIHEKLYQSKNFSSVDFGGYIKKLVKHLSFFYEGERKGITFNINIDNVFFDINRAIPLGLIINELVTNSLKYAFPHGEKGEIYIHIKKNQDGKYVFVIGDTGLGVKSDKEIFESETLGVQIVQDLVRQINGTIELDVKKGLAYRIVF